MKIAIILGSTRPGRFGEQVARWVLAQTEGREDAEFEFVDLRDYDLDLLNEPTVPGAAKRQYENPKTVAWGKRMDEFDGYVFVTAEYNHGVPAALKNAFDVLYPEWLHKGAALVSYGVDGGVRAVEHWRTILANAQMHVVRGQVSFSTMLEVEQAEGGDVFAPVERRAKEIRNVLTQLTKLTAATGSLRS